MTSRWIVAGVAAGGWFVVMLAWELIANRKRVLDPVARALDMVALVLLSCAFGVGVALMRQGIYWPFVGILVVGFGGGVLATLAQARRRQTSKP
jgi:F0F1-type ATP synthase assembly protein I